MSFRTIQRTAMISFLAFGAVTALGCDDDDKNETDAGDNGGNNNNNNNNNGGDDAGNNGEEDAGKPRAGIECGDTFCKKGTSLLGQCCSGEDEDICGIDLAPPGMPSLGCFPADAPGVGSDNCAMVLDGLEMDGKVPGKFEISAGAVVLELPACCTEAGSCGVDSSMTGMFGDLGLGCLDARAFQPPADPANPPVYPTEANGLPIPPNLSCDKTSGAGTCNPAFPPFLTGGCPATVANDCIVNVERNIKGCGATATWDRVSLQGLCIDNVAETVYGCNPVSAATLARLPEFICGCGATTVYTAGVPCLSNTPESTCGTVALDTTGADKVAGNADDCIASTPEFEEIIRGCGDTVVWDRTGGPETFCISNTPDTLFGCKQIEAKPTCVDGAAGNSALCNVPSFACGCGDGNPGTGACVPNIPNTICGGKAVCKAVAFGTKGDCFGGEVCNDKVPTPADGIGDACECSLVPTDSCKLVDTNFTCSTIGSASRCSCGAINAQGNCGEAKVCKDTNTDGFGDTCM